jgi:hypothetical protein
MLSEQLILSYWAKYEQIMQIIVNFLNL